MCITDMSTKIHLSKLVVLFCLYIAVELAAEQGLRADVILFFIIYLLQLQEKVENC